MFQEKELYTGKVESAETVAGKDGWRTPEGQRHCILLRSFSSRDHTLQSIFFCMHVTKFIEASFIFFHP